MRSGFWRYWGRVGQAGMAVVLAAGLSSCSEGTGSGDGIAVVASVYPLEWLAQEVGGDTVSVTGLTEPGTDPHDLELTPRQIGAMGNADLLLYVQDLQPAVDDAAAQHAGEHALDVADLVTLREVDEEDGGGTDPHVWLDTERMARVATATAERLAEIDPDRAATYRANAEAVSAELEAIDEEYAGELADCEVRTFVVSHAAFGYLAERYELEQIAISGIEPESEPSPARIAQVAELVEETGATTIFTEVSTSPRVAEVLAEETGANVDTLDPLEGITDRSPGDDYPSVMRANLDALSTALRCA